MTDSELRALYEEQQLSLPQIAERTSLSVSAVRSRLLRAGVTLRSHEEAIRLRSRHLSERARGRRRRPFTELHRRNISQARRRHGDRYAKGVTATATGYLKYTRGPHKHRLVHVVRMEERLGRRLLPDETVHHIDGDRQNNREDNLALVTRAGHCRLHRREDELAGRRRARDAKGRFTGGRIDDAGADNRNDPSGDAGHGRGDDPPDQVPAEGPDDEGKDV